MALLRLDREEKADGAIETFKRDLIVAHPQTAGAMIRALDGEDEQALHQRPWNEEELDELSQERLSADEINRAMSDLRSLGFSLEG